MLRNSLFVYNSGSIEITEFAINPNNLAIKGTFIDPEGIKLPRSEGSPYLFLRFT